MWRLNLRYMEKISSAAYNLVPFWKTFESEIQQNSKQEQYIKNTFHIVDMKMCNFHKTVYDNCIKYTICTPSTIYHSNWAKVTKYDVDENFFILHYIEVGNVISRIKICILILK